MILQGGQDGTAFRDLVVEGEDRIHIEFERPELHVDLDPQSAPGLAWGSIEEILDRHEPDRVTPFLTISASDRSPYRARPWFDHFKTGDLVCFRPQVEGVDRWQLLIANSRGQTVASFDGKGKPPKEIGWDGRSPEGVPVAPGLTYSYVLEAFDRAGNKRSFVGDGFRLPSYRILTSECEEMLFSGRELSSSDGSLEDGIVPPPSILLEIAGRVNQSRRFDKPVRVEVTARSFSGARALADDVLKTLEPLVPGGAARFQPVTNVEPDAPDEGTIRIVVSH
jgi:hypothetical protein